MYTILSLVAVIASFFLIISVLLQASKGSGLAGSFGGISNVGTMFGTRRTADFLSKSTWWLAGTLVVLALIINLFFLPKGLDDSSAESIIQKSGRKSIPTQPSLPTNTQK